MDLLKVDVSKAFNKIPFQLIDYISRKNKWPRNIAQYILNSLNLRFSKYGQMIAGVAQGDPLSLEIFN